MSSLLRTSAGAFGLSLLLASYQPQLVSASLPINICASFNTADMGKNISIYQTNGLCHDFCTADYAYAITQSQACWCSNYTPDKSIQVDTGECNIPCPAYPDEHCGGKGLFGYVELDAVLPSGTKGPDSSSQTSAVDVIKTTNIIISTHTVQDTVTISASSDATSLTASTTTSTTSSDSSKTDTASKGPTTTAVRTLTTDTGGAVQTVTIFPTVTGDSEGGHDGSSSGSKGLGTGAIVGITIGVIAAVLGAAGIGVMLFLRRRRQNQDDAAYQEDPSVSARGSSSDRMNSIRPEMSAAAAASPVTPSHNSNRNSTLAVDPRMNPFNKGLYGNTGSQESINTLRDDHDYSRRIQPPVVLRATNPDPEGGN